MRPFTIRDARTAFLLVALTALPAVLRGASSGGALPDRLYVDDRPDVAWLSLEAALASGPTSSWSAWGEFAPDQLLSEIEQRRLWPQRRPALLGHPALEELDRRLARVRDEHGNCTRGMRVGHSRAFVSTFDFAASHDRIVAGTIESRTLGFLYGRRVTVYGLRVRSVLQGRESATVRRDRVVFVPHGDFDASIEGMDACLWAESRPAVPEVGLRAAVGLANRPLGLGTDTGKSGKRYTFAGAWVTNSFWFETENGGAWTTMPGADSTWDRVERALGSSASRAPQR